ncbi:hypothetical protein FGE12_06520 [Aggregicoccus sp. 17bor-14]|uniref:hypothetical protein n=1 Tax=Myxococcaceae TaxID=31 RepID=UPI00129C6A48|nr:MULTISPECIES: hypothetical protein [Myxococcaceae]MBF5042042.1 hypothetical protein [Simulacricoccus sp. 17bor-14]MRI87821.1 hypothetical protein [Aggregicoccus sp. 17bor-14]
MQWCGSSRVSPSMPPTLSPTPRLLLALLPLTFLSAQAHELTHHLVAAPLCGGFGRLYFWTFTVAPGCYEARPWAVLATAAGPLFTYGLMYVGAGLLWRGGGAAAWGAALLAAQMPLARLVTVATGRGGDEGLVARALLGDASAWRPVIGVAALALMGPPVWALARAAAPGWPRARWTLALLLVPMLWSVLLRPLETRLDGLAPEALLGAGVPWVIAVTDSLVVLALLALWRPLARAVATAERGEGASGTAPGTR